MKTLLVTIGIVVAGCSMEPVTEISPDRLQVTDRLRVACPDVTDGEIDALIIATEQVRIFGGDKLTEISKAIEQCEEIAFDPTVCTTCSIVIIDQVYGDD